jgi:hypothetical protein
LGAEQQNVPFTNDLHQDERELILNLDADPSKHKLATIDTGGRAGLTVPVLPLRHMVNAKVGSH